MKVAVLNFSGNVGKTTVSAHLLKPRIPTASVFSVESINSGADSTGLEVEKVRGNEFGSLINDIMSIDDAIVDIGASNVEAFLKKMNQYSGSHEEFDFFLVPVTKENKVLQDSINTLEYLRTLGVAKDKIKVIFNKIDTDDNIEHDFAPIFGYAKHTDTLVINSKSTIKANEVYELLKLLNKSIGDINSDTTDYRTISKTAKTDKEKDRARKMALVKMLSISANENLDAVYASLFS
jgi:dimeric dUTPase (all-alpha-NTP-PPase superfamily)